MAFVKIWNGKLKGVPALLGISIARIWEIVCDHISTYQVRGNISKCGRNTKILRGFKYRYPNNISIGNNVTIGSDVIFSSELATGSIVIMDNVVIGRNCKIDFSGGIIIGENSLLSEGVVIQTHSHGLDPRSKPEGCSLTIEKDVWIGLSATILYNTRSIGEKSIIAAASLVTKPVAGQSVYAGVPAVKIKNVYG